jgi:hypothetical protein
MDMHPPQRKGERKTKPYSGISSTVCVVHSPTGFPLHNSPLYVCITPFFLNFIFFIFLDISRGLNAVDVIFKNEHFCLFFFYRVINGLELSIVSFLISHLFQGLGGWIIQTIFLPMNI